MVDNKEEGNGLRYEWFLENGKVIGTSKLSSKWYPKRNKGVGKWYQKWLQDGIMIIQIMRECFYIDNKEHGLRPYWF